MALSWWNRFLKPKSPPTPRRRGRPARRRLALEPLEDRAVPTVFFSPQFGAEAATDNGGLKLPDPPVYLIFWGSGWTSSTTPSTTAVTNAASTLLSGPYLSRLSQYGSGLGHAHFVKSVIDSSDPSAAVFTDADVRKVVERAIDTGVLPDTHATANIPIYAVVT